MAVPPRRLGRNAALALAGVRAEAPLLSSPPVGCHLSAGHIGSLIHRGSVSVHVFWGRTGTYRTGANKSHNNQPGIPVWKHRFNKRLLAASIASSGDDECYICSTIVAPFPLKYFRPVWKHLMGNPPPPVLEETMMRNPKREGVPPSAHPTGCPEDLGAVGSCMISGIKCLKVCVRARTGRAS